jgi:hypothetical protein
MACNKRTIFLIQHAYQMLYSPEIVGRKFLVGEKGVKYLGEDINIFKGKTIYIIEYNFWFDTKL